MSGAGRGPHGAPTARPSTVLVASVGDDAPAATSFSSAIEALSAAIDLQPALRARERPDGAAPRVRLALDTHGGAAAPGLASARLGVAVARCTRLCAVARDGQVLLSRATRDLVAHHLPAGVGLADLGVHRLPDLGRPERVYALVGPDAAAGGAEPPRSLDALPNNLPSDLTTFVGRELELAEVARVLAGARLVTLAGSGGCGKTRLALQSGADATGRFPDGVWWVDLAPLPEPGLVGQALARAVGVRPAPGQAPLDAAVAHLAARRALVILDNCEHLVEGAAECAAALVRGCPEVNVLATSREPLGLDSEAVWRVPSLSLPEQDAGRSVDALARSDAVRLFLERAAKVRPDLDAAASGPALAELCSRLDGIPLAIELAAARIGLMSVEQISAALTDRFLLLSRAARTALPRHRTLRASVDWSHDLLSETERTVLRRLGVFSGGFTPEAVRHVALEGVELPVAEALRALVDKSLVVVDQGDSAVRYRLLETVREYALERLAEAGEAEAVRDRHGDYFLALAERAAPELATARQLRWLEALDLEAANLGAALDRWTATDPERALRLCAALTFWWKLRGRFADAHAGTDRALRAAPTAPRSLRARVLWGRSYLLAHYARYEEAAATAAEALELAEAADDPSTASRALYVLGDLARSGESGPSGGLPPLAQARELALHSGDEWCFATASVCVAWSHLFMDEYVEARRLFDEALPYVERVGDGEVLAWYWSGRSHLHSVLGANDRALEAADRALAAARAVGEPVSEGMTQSSAALIEIATGRAEDAVARLESTRERLVATGGSMMLGRIDRVLARAQAHLGDLDGARERLERMVATRTAAKAVAMAQLADVLRAAGAADGAEEWAGRALELANRLRSPMVAAWASEILGRLATDRSAWGRAAALLDDAMSTRARLGLEPYLPKSFDALAELEARLGGHEEAALLLGAAEGARSRLGSVRWGPDEPRLEALDRRLRAALGDERFRAAHEAGTALSSDEAVERTLRRAATRRRPPTGWESLTPAELKVARRAARGMTNRAIGQEMFVSPATVKTHLARIYAKLGVRNRAELTASLVRRG
ncbi:MAG TPA: LuxR C-terminal-related transcriptional regulator [Thermoleophilaceae bacterium]|jgi:predicted ATPase/DNA-binding CsgD family transcriptional regulator